MLETSLDAYLRRAGKLVSNAFTLSINLVSRDTTAGHSHHRAEACFLPLPGGRKSTSGITDEGTKNTDEFGLHTLPYLAQSHTLGIFTHHIIGNS